MNGNEILLTVASGAATVSTAGLKQLSHKGMVRGRYGPQIYHAPLAVRLSAISAPAAVRAPFTWKRFRPMK